MTAVLEDVNSLDATAEYLKLSTTKLVRLARSLRIGHVKDGHDYTFTRAHIDAYVKAHTINPLPANPHGLTASSTRRIRTG